MNITHPELGTANRKDTKATCLTIVTSLDLTGNHSPKILLPNSFQIRMEWDLGTESTSAHGPEDKNDGLSVPVKPAGILYCPLLCYRKPSITSVRIWFAVRTMCSFYCKSWFLSTCLVITNPGFCTVLLIRDTFKVSKYYPHFTNIYFGVWASKTICSKLDWLLCRWDNQY